LLILWVYLHSFSRRWLSKIAKSHEIPPRYSATKFRQNLTLPQLKVIQGHRSWCQSKAHVWLSVSH